MQGEHYLVIDACPLRVDHGDMLEVLTQDMLDWYSTDRDPGDRGELLVETFDHGYQVMDASQPFPVDAFRWAKLPPRLRK